MVKFNIKMTKIAELNEFAQTALKCSGDVIVKKGRFIIDGKSIMGLYSIDTSNGVDVELSNNEDINLFENMIHHSPASGIG